MYFHCHVSSIWPQSTSLFSQCIFLNDRLVFAIFVRTANCKSQDYMAEQRPVIMERLWTRISNGFWDRETLFVVTCSIKIAKSPICYGS